MPGSANVANGPVPSQKTNDRGLRCPKRDAAEMTNQSPVERAAYANIVAAVADARPDPATERFDAEIASAVADGRIDQQFARTLRWWQRESVRGVRDHLVEVLPPLLESLDASALRPLRHSDAPERSDPADKNFAATAKSAPGHSGPRTVSTAVSAQRSPQHTQHRRRVLVASLVAATNSRTAMRFESGEGRR
jgi:hypothetical protein